jgi:hypothetical protein
MKIEDSDKELLTLRIIALALLGGPSMFLLITLGIYFTASSDSATDQDPSLLMILTAISLGLCVTSHVVGPLLQTVSIKQSLKKESIKPIMAYQTGFILRAGLAEGPALMGVVCILIAVQSGVVPSFVWLNLIPYIAFAVLTFMTFPSKSGIEETLMNITGYFKG